MQPLVWTTPWALAGLAAVPALLAIYWLRLRYRPQPVSTLLFWRDIPELRDAGVRWQRLQLPLLFFLELLAILSLVGAALGLHVLSVQRGRPLVVILDDSLSMRAGQPSARQRAEQALRDLWQKRRFASIRLLLAGPNPQWAGEAVSEVRELEPMLATWKCWQVSAALGRALTAAREWGGRDALLLVVTDTAPKEPLEAGAVQWWAFGQDLPNVAIVHALRTAGAERDRIVLEIANYSQEPRSTTLTLRLGDNVQQTTSLALQPGETQTVHYTVSSQVKVVEAVLPGDALALDNQVWLVRQAVPPVHVSLQLNRATLRATLEKALGALGNVVLDTNTPHVLITDSPNGRPSDHTWLVQLLLEKDGEAFAGPFLLDSRHPLCEGLSLQEVIWGARREPLEGTPIVTVGDISLISETVRGWNRRHIRIRLIPELTTWPRTPDWPIFWENLVYWRRSEFPGLDSSQGRLGEVMRVKTGLTSLSLAAKNTASVICRSPDGSEQQYAVQQGWAFVPLRQLGVHEVIFGDQCWPLAVNMVNPSESDLRASATGRWGEWVNEEILRRDYRDTSWAFLLAALAVLMLHGWLVSRSDQSLAN